MADVTAPKAIPCICGHARGSHQVIPTGTEERPAFRLALCGEWACRCERYIPDTEANNG